jgi:glycosyltransferase involved in cell wall biosynthesis
MRILYISSKKNWGGVTNWMNQTALGLERRGHNLWIIAHPNGRFIKSASRKLSMLPKKLGMDYNPYMVVFIWRFIVKNRIDLIVTNIEKEVILGGMASRLGRIPNVRRVGREDDFNEKFRVQWHHRLLVDRCIVPCDLIRNNALKRAGWLDGSMFTTIYNGRNPETYSTQEKVQQKKAWGLAAHDFVIGSNTQLTKVKGTTVLISALAEILKTHPGCYLVITGEGPERKNLELQARDLGISDRVVFGGFTSNPLRSAAAYDIAVSVSLFEGFPNTVVEYFAAGTPVVATDAGGVSEMVENMKNGLIVPCGDVQKLHDGLVLLMEKPQLREDLRKNALRTVEAKFSEDIMVDKLETFFKETINTHRIQGVQEPRGQVKC